MNHARGVMLAGAGMVVISPDGLLIKLLGDVGPWDVMLWRAAAFVFGLALLDAARGRLGATWAAFRARPRLYLVSGALLGVANICFVHAMRETSVTHTLVIFATIPFWSALIARIWLGEPVAGRTMAAMGLGVLGVAILMAGGVEEAESSLFGDLLALAAAVAASVALVAAREAGEAGMAPALFIQGLFGAVVSAPLATGAGVDGGAVLMLMLMGAVMLPIAWTLIMAGARHAPAADIALLATVETILGPIWAWIGLGLAPGPMAALGGAIVVAGVAMNAALAIREERRADRLARGRAGS